MLDEDIARQLGALVGMYACQDVSVLTLEVLRWPAGMRSAPDMRRTCRALLGEIESINGRDYFQEATDDA